ncbi:MAG: NUDIX domain-containing protein [Candidatus Thorarchaeota archaeon]|nr:NUDIX domain-containing protein [Candidatus Thorarchaeota archaeon]
MTKLIPIAITILRVNQKFLLLKRRNPPYANLWGLVGGKLNIGEHIPSAALREVMEETGSSSPTDYILKGIVSERLVGPEEELKAHFLIFVGNARIDSFAENHREGELALFNVDEIEHMKGQIVPSDYEMFMRFHEGPTNTLEYHEAELVEESDSYRLAYYREGGF